MALAAQPIRLADTNVYVSKVENEQLLTKALDPSRCTQPTIRFLATDDVTPFKGYGDDADSAYVCVHESDVKEE